MQISADAVAQGEVTGAALPAENAAGAPTSNLPAWKRDLQVKAVPSEEAEPAAILPSGWQQHLDPTSGRPYYCNRQTGMTQWEVPAEPMQAREAGSAKELPHGWIALQAEDGRQYFANTITGKTQWDPPACDK